MPPIPQLQLPPIINENATIPHISWNANQPHITMSTSVHTNPLYISVPIQHEYQYIPPINPFHPPTQVPTSPHKRPRAKNAYESVYERAIIPHGSQVQTSDLDTEMQVVICLESLSTRYTPGRALRYAGNLRCREKMISSQRSYRNLEECTVTK